MSKNDTVGIITFYHENYNFGGLLQAYALPMAIQKYFGLSAEQIDYALSVGRDNPASHSHAKVRLMGNPVYRLGIWFFSRLEHTNLSKRKEAFDQFIGDIPHSNQTYDVRTISECRDQYGICVCGGVQIWNDC